MAQQTITALFDRYEQASAAVGELESSGIPHGDVSLVSNNEKDQHAGLLGDGHASTDTREKAKDGTGAGATLGTLAGGAAGLLAGLGLIAIPGVGPVVAARLARRHADGGRHRCRRGRPDRSADGRRGKRGRRAYLRRGRAAGWDPRHGPHRPHADRSGRHGDGGAGAARRGRPRREGQRLARGRLDGPGGFRHRGTGPGPDLSHDHRPVIGRAPGTGGRGVRAGRPGDRPGMTKWFAAPRWQRGAHKKKPIH